MNTGFVREIPINAKSWAVEYVKDAVSGALLLNKSGQPMALKALGIEELAAGWLRLEKRAENDGLIVFLEENFSAEPRKFLVGIVADGKSDVLSFTQTKGEAYALISELVIELPATRKEYTSDEGLHTITLTNNTSVAKNMEITDLFKDVKYVSEFSSTDYGAFDWMNAQGTKLTRREIVRDGVSIWAGELPYKEGNSYEPYVKEGDKVELLVQPYSSIRVRGEMLYMEREGQYTLEVRNLSSGRDFQVSGTWKQKIPVSPTTYIYK